MNDDKLYNEISQINNELINAKRELFRLNGALETSLATNKELLAELQHRVKNSFSIISSMIGLATTATVSQEAHLALAEIDDRVRSISTLYSMLYASGSFEDAKLDEYCLQIGSALVALSESVTLETALQPVIIAAAQAAPIGLIVTELITNCLKYAFPGLRSGRISMTLAKSDTKVTLEIADDGIGLSEGFGTGLIPGAGMGLSLVQALAGQIGGSFSIRGLPTGTISTLEFPLATLDR